MTESNETKPKRFEFPEVDCNECEHYWVNQCDGSNLGSKRLCKEFLATRQSNIPLEIKSLREALKWLRISVLSLLLVVIVMMWRMYL